MVEEWIRNRPPQPSDGPYPSEEARRLHEQSAKKLLLEPQKKVRHQLARQKSYK